MVQPLELLQQQRQSSQCESQQQLLGRLQLHMHGIKFVKMEAEDDPEAFLSAFECAAEGAYWPREQWALRLVPFLSMEAQAIYHALPNYASEDYDQLKDAILGHLLVSDESCRKKFRNLTFTAGVRPRIVAHQLKDLGRKWLKPEIRTSADIVELILVEQFIQILPAFAGEWLSHHQVCSLDSAVQLIEVYLAGEGLAASEGGVSIARASVNEDELLTEEFVTVKLEVIPNNEEWEPQHLDEREKIENTDGGCVAVKPESLTRIEEGERTSFMGCQDLKESDRSEELEEPSSRDCEVSEKQERTECSFTETVFRNTYLERDSTDYYLKLDPCEIFEKNKGDVYSKQKEFIKIEKKTNPSTNKPSPSIDSEISVSQLINSTRQLGTCSAERTNTINEYGQNFRMSSSHKSNERTHMGEQSNTCIESSNSVGQSVTHVMNQRLAWEEEGYSCNECGKTFNQSTDLIRHHQIHSKDKPYTCTECGKGFAQISNLNKHQRTHSGRKPHVCTDCGKCFSFNSILIQHRRIHTGGRGLRGAADLNPQGRDPGGTQHPVRTRLYLVGGSRALRDHLPSKTTSSPDSSFRPTTLP